MYYHIRIYVRGETRAEFRLDLTLDELRAQYLDRYFAGDDVMIRGRVVGHQWIERVRVNRTEVPSDSLRAQAQERRRGLVTSSPVELTIAGLGEDVTDQLVNRIPETRPAATRSERRESSEVFVVHGRDALLRGDFFSFLRSVGLKPLEWSQAVAKTGKASPYIGEVLDAAFESAGAVVVLLSPDDEARLRQTFLAEDDPEHERALTPQSRPNVLFEAGMAMGYSPDRTVLVSVGELRPFSDIAGRHVVRLDNSAEKRTALIERLRGSGLPIDTSGQDWLHLGDFER